MTVAHEANIDIKKGSSSLLHNLAFRGVAYQVLLAAAIVLLAYLLYQNVNANLEKQRIATGFDFLNETSGFDIGETLIEYDSEDSYGRALLVGIMNTLSVAACGIVLATILGTIMGIARVSRNWLASILASGYVEICRNVPVVLHVIFWASVIRNLPSPKQALSPMEGVFLANRGFIFPVPEPNPAYTWVWVALAAGVVLAFGFNYWAQKRREKTGKYIATLWPCIGIVIGLPLAAWLVQGAPLVWSVPELKGFNFRGGASLTPEFIALLIGITFYTGAFIAEIVRAGIQAVSHGQTEAAFALGIKPNWTMRLIIIPQALRIATPPQTSNCIAIAKDTSLASVVAMPDLLKQATDAQALMANPSPLIAAAAIYLIILWPMVRFVSWLEHRAP